MESSNIFPSVGSIPLSNFSLNSTESGYDPVTHSSVIQLRDTGDIALKMQQIQMTHQTVFF